MTVIGNGLLFNLGLIGTIKGQSWSMARDSIKKDLGRSDAIFLVELGQHDLN